jgi:hypothetical protein
VLGSRAEQERIRTLEHAAYRPGASVESEAELSALLLRLRGEAEALDRAVEASGMLEPGGSGAVATSARVVPPEGSSALPSAAGSTSVPASASSSSSAAAPAPAPASPAERWRHWWTRPRILIAALAVVALAAVVGNVVQASTPSPSLDVFARAAEPPDEGRSDFVNQVLLQGVMGAGPVRYLGEQHGVRVFAALVGDTFHNPADPQEGVCLTGFLGSDRLDTSTTNCALRDDFDRLGVAVFFTESPSGELESSATSDATRAIVWGPAGGLREVDGAELDRLVAAGCASNLSFRAREDCVS